MPAWLIPAITGATSAIGSIFGSKDKSKDEKAPASSNWGEFGTDLAQGGILGTLNYLLSSGDRAKREELGKILMDLVKQQKQRQDMEFSKFQEYGNKTSPLIAPLAGALQGRLSNPLAAPSLKIDPFKNYTGPLTARM